jgi:hypothetical protein
MPASKIHCDFFEIYGPDWAELDQEQVDCLLERIDKMELLGDPPDLRGFVGTRRIGNTIGGFFAIQYQDIKEYFDRDKNRVLKPDAPFEKLFFILLADKGKLLLQNRKFVDIPLSMSKASDLLREALNGAMAECRLGKRFILGFYRPETDISADEFVQEFHRSTRVVRLSVTDPDPAKIPDDFVYYNPQRERNQIVADSHRHDYPNFKKVDLEAADSGDIRITHTGKDLVLAGTGQIMTYFIGEEQHILRREAATKFEVHVDMDAPQLKEDQMRAVLDMLRRERALDLERPTPTRATPPQMTLFDSPSEGPKDED